LPDPLIERAHTGQRRLRFTVSIANVGAGPIEVHGVRLTTRSPFSTWQWILRTDGSSVRVRTPSVRMVFVGTESHGHWHVRGAARYELRRLDRGTLVRVRMKRGFCLFDSTPYRRSIPGSPAERRYPREACGKQGALVFTMGISPGWKDDYYWRIPGQEIDVTNLPHGRYRLLVTVDPRNWFRESNERNNVAWVDFVLSDSLLVKVLGRSPRL
ncbi:MAG: lysyl oxidase family protein, partial [Thermoleophilia bacterium]|nr:lysyl oxidase family protein [Thermoleophilia bacterium]